MRVAPLPLRFAGAELAEAAEVQARLTHGHPNAAEAAVAASWLTRQLLEGGMLTSALVMQAVAQFSEGVWSSTGGTTAAALGGEQIVLDLNPRHKRQLVHFGEDDELLVICARELSKEGRVTSMCMSERRSDTESVV